MANFLYQTSRLQICRENSSVTSRPPRKSSDSTKNNTNPSGSQHSVDKFRLNKWIEKKIHPFINHEQKLGRFWHMFSSNQQLVTTRMYPSTAPPTEVPWLSLRWWMPLFGAACAPLVGRLHDHLGHRNTMGCPIIATSWASSIPRKKNHTCQAYETTRGTTT